MAKRGSPAKSFQGERSVLKVDVQTAEWMIELTGLGILVKDAQCEIEYADGKVLRLRGKGLAKPGGGHGDQYVTLKVVLPDAPDQALEDFVKDWSGRGYNPRRAMEG